MPSFTPEQLRNLRAQCNTVPLMRLRTYAQQGYIKSSSELPDLTDERRRYLDSVFAAMAGHSPADPPEISVETPPPPIPTPIPTPPPAPAPAPIPLPEPEPEEDEEPQESAERYASLPDINDAIAHSRKECYADATDVYFFGIPSTGKSCVLMGLMGSSRLHTNFVHAAGSYAAALSQYLDAGVTVPSTPQDFVATVQSKVTLGDREQFINLVEMSGEEFAFKLANNEHGVISLADMGTGAPELLRNPNRKIFFIIIDPTVTTLSFNRVEPVLDSRGKPLLNEDGMPVTRPRNFKINQKVVIKKLLDTLFDPLNAPIMDRVDALHFLVTKADLLGSGPERDRKAEESFRAVIGNELPETIARCKRHGINRDPRKERDGHPYLHPFSLGEFHSDGDYTYDPADSERLLTAIIENSGIPPKEGVWSAFKRFLNRPLSKN